MLSATEAIDGESLFAFFLLTSTITTAIILLAKIRIMIGNTIDRMRVVLLVSEGGRVKEESGLSSKHITEAPEKES